MKQNFKEEYSTGDAPGMDAPSRLVVEAMGALFERVGMRSLLGRIWGILYISKQPLGGRDLQVMLGVSSGAVSMGVNELVDLGLVHRTVSRGSRRFVYYAETEMWPLVTKVFRDQERIRIAAPVARLKEAEKILSEMEVDPESEAGYRLEQVRHLVRLGSFVLDILDAFMERTRVEVKAAQKWLSVSGKLGGEPLSRLRKRINAGLRKEEEH